MIAPGKAVALTLMVGMILLTLAAGWWLDWNGGWDA